MRREAMPLPDGGEAEDKQDEQTATEGAAPSAAATATVAAPKGEGKLTALMALEEPARTEALEKATTAGLTVSDWKTDKSPGGPIGQELMFNFIQIQPYLEE